MARIGATLVIIAWLLVVTGMNIRIPLWIPTVLFLSSLVMLIREFRTRQALWFTHAVFVSGIGLIGSYLVARYGVGRMSILLVKLPIFGLLIVSLLIPVIHARYQKSLPKDCPQNSPNSISPNGHRVSRWLISRSRKQSPVKLEQPNALDFILGEEVSKK